jgi:hypothetical protein
LLDAFFFRQGLKNRGSGRCFIMNSKWKELLAMILIGDGVLNVMQPRRHSAIWNCGPKSYKDVARQLEGHPEVARGLGIALIGLGLLLGHKAGSAISG